jgi:hypothetical protein
MGCDRDSELLPLNRILCVRKSSNVRKQIVLTSGIFFVLFLAEWWFFYSSALNIPEYIPNTQIHIGGLALIITIILLFIWEFKRLLRIQPPLSIWKLAFSGTLTVFIAEVLFQTLRQFYMNIDTPGGRLYNFILGALGISLFSFVLGFLIAFQLKTKRTSILFLLIILVFILIYITKKYIMD